MTINQRVKELIEATEKSQANFAKKHNLTKQLVNQWTNKGSVGIEVVKQLLSFYPNLNVNWLLFGEGQMLNNEVSTDKSVDCKLCEEKTERIKELKDQIALLTNINEDIKQQLNMKKDILMECMERNRTLSKQLEIMQNIIETKIITDSGNTVKPEKKMP